MNLAVYLSKGTYQAANWLRHLSGLLVDAAYGRRKRLICEVPPRHGKSQLIARWYVVWLLELFPDKKIGVLTYGQDLADQHGRWIRDTIEANSEFLTVRIRRDRRSINDFETTEGGTVSAIGLDGAVTGKGFDILIIDDPVKDEQEANSETERESIWQKWLDRLRTRIEPGGSCIVLHTRWHVDDFIGRLLKPENQHTHEWTWDEIRFPAIADHVEGYDALGRLPGDALWPERWPAEYILSLRHGNEGGWQALYQQNPFIRDGGHFNPAWFEMVEHAPFGCKWIRFWDLASTAKSRKASDPDFTAGCLIGAINEEYYVANMVRLRGNPDQVLNKVKEVADADGIHVTQWFEQEPGSAGKLLIRNIARTILPRHKVKGFHLTGPKETYADTAANRAEMGRVKIVTGGWQVKEFLEELQGFPKWSHDDQVDAFSKGIAAHEKKAAWGVVSERNAA